MEREVSGEKKKKFAADTSGRTPGDWVKALLVLLAGLTIAHSGGDPVPAV